MVRRMRTWIGTPSLGYIDRGVIAGNDARFFEAPNPFSDSRRGKSDLAAQFGE